MSIQGNWAGDYQGEWFGSSGGPGPDYKLAALTVTGTGTAVMTAQVQTPAPALGPVGGGWIEYRKKLKKLEDEEPKLTQTGHLLVPTTEDVSTAIALVRHRKAKYNAAEQQRKDEEELLLMF